MEIVLFWMDNNNYRKEIHEHKRTNNHNHLVISFPR
jgi:hypothetical protein